MNNRPVALITGASRGIGEATARELAQRGYALVLAARSVEPLQALAAELTRQGCPALPVPSDLSKSADVTRLVRIAHEHFGRIDVLVNNAGVGDRSRSFERATPEGVHEVVSTNLLAPIELTRLVLPSMRERNSGAIIFIGSVMGHIAMPQAVLYSTTKAALRGFSRSLRHELSGTNVRVSLIAPGFIDTAMTAWLQGVPKSPPSLVARTIADVMDCSRREVVIPGFYHAFILLDRFFPGFVDLVLGLYARWNRRQRK